MYVYAAATTSTSFNGRIFRLKEGEAWAANDPLVKARPDMFNDTPKARTSGPRPVEEATAVPGRKRRRG